MGLQEVRNYFEEQGLGEAVVEKEFSTATVALAAAAIGTEERRIGKTMGFRDKEGKGLLIVMAGDAKVQNRKFKDFFGFKARMLNPEELLELTGHPMGGVCPFALKQALPVYLDESLKRFDIIYPAAGSENSFVKLKLEELEKHSGFEAWIEVTTWLEEE